jgi:hypothetical protein
MQINDSIIIEEIKEQWSKGINPAIYNRVEHYKPNPSKRIEEIDNLIEQLKAEKNLIIKEYINSIESFEEKFKYWFLNCDTKEHLKYMPSNPVLRKWIDVRDFQRYQTINIEERLEEDFELIINKEFRQQGFDAGWMNQEKYDKIVELAKEVMNENIGSFTIDW